MDQDWARPVVHWEIRGQDTEKLAAFYGQLFNWKIGDTPLMNIPAGIGAPDDGPGGGIIRSKTPGIVLYIQVLSLKDTLARVPGLGGTVTREPFDLPTGVTIAWITDPEDNRLVLVQQ